MTPRAGPGATSAFLLAMVIASLASAQQVAPEIVAPAARDVTPPGFTPGPSGSGPLIREPAPPAPLEPARWQRFVLPKTTDAATFLIKSRTIRIAGVTAPKPDMACENAGDREWPCGRTALHSLRMFLRGRAVECFFPDINTAVDITAPCRVGATDLGLWLLSQGWARPDNLATEEYEEAAENARCNRRGLWRGSEPDENCPDPAQG